MKALDRTFRIIGGVFGLAGLTLAATLLLADQIGLGVASGLGWQQALVAGLGMLMAVAGIVVVRKPPHFDSLGDLLGKLTLLSGGILVGLLASEGFFRIYRPPSVEVNHAPTVYQPDEELGYRFAPDSSDYIERIEFREPVRINSAGFFDDEYPQVKPPGVTRIATIGDSFTAGLHVGREKNFPDLLERQLNDSDVAGCPCEVLNFGLPGTGTTQQYGIFEHMVLDYEPSIVLLGFHANDPVDVLVGSYHLDVYRGYVMYYREETERADLERQVDGLLDNGGRTLRFGIQNLYIVRALYNVWLKREGHPEPNLRDNRISASFEPRYTRDEAVSQIIEVVDKMLQVCQEAECELVIVVIPSKGEVSGEREMVLSDFVEPLAERQVRVLYLLEPFRDKVAQGEEIYYRIDGHPNEEGHRLIAEEIASYLQEEELMGTK